MTLRTKTWTKEQVAEAKRDVKAELDGLGGNLGNAGKLDYILKKIAHLEKAHQSDELLRLYVYIMSALVHHERNDGLSNTEIDKLVTYAHELLRVQKVAPMNSTLSFLYAEVHLILSQIFRKSGRAWAAAWEQQVSFQLAKTASPEGDILQAVSKGILALSIGHGLRSLHEFATAESGGPEGGLFERARIGRIRALRLAGLLDEAEAMIQVTEAVPQVSDKFATELQWERLCLLATRKQDLDPMLKSVQDGGPHYQAVYIAEAFLWTLAVRERKWEKRIFKMRTLARKPELNARSLKFFLKAVVCLENCQDDEIPLVNRVRMLGETLEEEAQFTAVDRKLLFLVAASRWLAKARLTDLSAITLYEYRALCYKLSDGVSTDVLGLAGDLFARGWFAQSLPQAEVNEEDKAG